MQTMVNNLYNITEFMRDSKYFPEVTPQDLISDEGVKWLIKFIKMQELF